MNAQGLQNPCAIAPGGQGSTLDQTLGYRFRLNVKDVWFPSRLDGSGEFLQYRLVWEGCGGVHSEFTPENTITCEAASRDFEAVLALVDKHHIVLITRDEKPDIVAMGFHYYLERFGRFLPEEEYKKLKALDKPSSEPDNKDTDDGAP